MSDDALDEEFKIGLDHHSLDEHNWQDGTRRYLRSANTMIWMKKKKRFNYEYSRK